MGDACDSDDDNDEIDDPEDNFVRAACTRLDSPTCHDGL